MTYPFTQQEEEQIEASYFRADLVKPSEPRQPRPVSGTPQFLLVEGFTTFGSGGAYVEFRHLSGPAPILQAGNAESNNGFFTEVRKWVTLPTGCVLRIVSGDCIGEGRVFVDDLLIGE